MRPVLVAMQPFLDSSVQLPAVAGRVQEDALILNRTPEALQVNIVQGPAPAVPADRDALLTKVDYVLR